MRVTLSRRGWSSGTLRGGMKSLSPALAVGLCALVALPACAGRERCAETAACLAGTVCQPDGTCAPFGDDLTTRFSRAVTVEARRIELSVADPNDDTLSLGGQHGTRLLVEFADLPDALPTAAELILEPHPEWSGANEETRVVVSRVRDNAPNANSTETIRSDFGLQTVPSGAPRPLRIDIRDALRDARRAGVRHLTLLVRCDASSERLAYARTPRPRLWLLVP